MVLTRECDKLNNHQAEWNAIYPFIEWLHEQGISFCRLNDIARFDRIGETTEDLLYKYFDVDPYTLELERRRILEGIELKRLRDKDGK